MRDLPRRPEPTPKPELVAKIVEQALGQMAANGVNEKEALSRALGSCGVQKSDPQRSVYFTEAGRQLHIKRGQLQKETKTTLQRGAEDNQRFIDSLNLEQDTEE